MERIPSNATTALILPRRSSFSTPLPQLMEASTMARSLLTAPPPLCGPRAHPEPLSSPPLRVHARFTRLISISNPKTSTSALRLEKINRFLTRCSLDWVETKADVPIEKS